MTTKEFIEKAIEGGFRMGNELDKDGEFTKKLLLDRYEAPPIEMILLDPLAWSAVGKVMGWEEHDVSNPTWHKSSHKEHVILLDKWENMMHRMIDSLCDGQTIEEFLSTL